MEITRREVLRQVLLAGLAGMAGYIAGTPKPEQSENRLREKIFRYNVSSDADTLRTLRHVLDVKQIEEVRIAISNHFSPPLRNLNDLGKTTLDYGIQVVQSEVSDLSNLNWRMRGTKMAGDLGKHLYLSATAELESDQRLSKLTLFTDLQHTFGTGLTPEIDQFIETDTTTGGRIAEKDLEHVGRAVFRLAYGGLRWQLGQVLGEKYIKAQLPPVPPGVEYELAERGGVKMTITRPGHTPRDF